MKNKLLIAVTVLMMVFAVITGLLMVNVFKLKKITGSDKSADDHAVVLSLVPTESTALQNQTYNFVQTEDAVEAGIAVHKYGAVIIPADDTDGVVLELESNGQTYQAAAAIKNTADVGDTVTLSPANF